MRGSSERSPINIAASTPKVQVDNRFPISKYYRTADNILKQAHIYREEKNVVDLYIILIRFSSLVGETIPEHNEYPTFSPRSKAEYRKKLSQVIFELEKLKPLAQQELKKFNSSIASVSSSKIEAKKGYEWPQMSGFQGSGSIGPIQPLQRTSNQMESHLSKLSLTLPPAKVETLSRHSFLGQNGLKSRRDALVTQAKVQYPTYIDTSPVEIPRFEESKNKSSALSEALGVDPFQSDAGAELASQLSLIRQPLPPPAAALVQNLPNTPHPATTGALIPPWKVADPFPGPTSMVQDGSKQTGGPKQLYISAGMMDEFLRLASRNTSKNLETCGVLAGSLKNASFRVTALIIPKQESTSDSCQTINEEEIFDWQDKRDLFQLGWIHTHPKQTCFMSSIDLHTHYSYQVMLPEAIAIVMAPTDTTRTWGIFRLSDPQGIKVIQNCQQRGFHPHEQPSDGSPLYEHCSHVLMSSKLNYEMVDLR